MSLVTATKKAIKPQHVIGKRKETTESYFGRESIMFTINGKNVLNKHPHDTVEQEIALVLIVSALLVTFAGFIVDSVNPKSFAYFEAKCIAGQTSNDSYVKSQAYWCDSAVNNLAICSWVAMLGSGMAYIGSITLYVSWRSVRPNQDADKASNAFYLTINFKIIMIYLVLVIAFIAIAGAQFMLQIFKFDFRHHRTFIDIAAVVVIFILQFLAWTVYDYRKNLLRRNEYVKGRAKHAIKTWKQNMEEKKRLQVESEQAAQSAFGMFDGGTGSLDQQGFISAMKYLGAALSWLPEVPSRGSSDEGIKISRLSDVSSNEAWGFEDSEE